ncbi:MAG: choice-of-anchor N protein [Chitinispirillaceae bacterium]|nr:choice-of-anchor N protein [Chitinispirillaceae bacterium]
MVVGSAWAVPVLQLDISGGIYDAATETIVAKGDVFTLYALFSPNPSEDMLNPYTLSMAVTPSIDAPADFGYFTIGEEVINVTDGMTYGTPASLEDLNGVANHDNIFPTYYKELSFSFNTANTTASYDAELTPGGFSGLDAEGETYFQAWTVDLSNLDAGNTIHFDLYGNVEKSNKIKAVFAPFSHDAEGSSSVPEPTTLSLIGIALLGIGVFRKKVR